MGKLLNQVEQAGRDYKACQQELQSSRAALRGTMQAAHDEGISMNKIAIAAGFTREGVRYALKGGQ